MERQGRISTKVFWGSRPGQEAPKSEQQRRHTRATNSHRAFLASFNNTQRDNWRRWGSTTGTLGALHGGRGGIRHGCIAKTKHLAGSLVWSGLYGFWTFFISVFFYPWIASCSLFHHHHHSKERVGWEEIPLICLDKFFLLVSGFLSNLYMSLFARALSLSLSRIILPWIACVFQQVEGGNEGDPCALCVDIAVVCAQWGLLIGHLEVWGTNRDLVAKSVRTNGWPVSERVTRQGAP